MALPTAPAAPPPDPRRPKPEHGVVTPRKTAPDTFEQNPLSQVAERLSHQAADGLDDAIRVREALRIVIAEGVSINEAARRCHVAPSCLVLWREKYVALLNDTPSIAPLPLLEKGAVLKDADLVTIPRAAREQFADNWERLLRVTRATASSFRQHPVQIFLENSWLTGWLYTEGRLDRGTFAGASTALLVLVLTATFLMAGHFYRRDDTRQAEAFNYDASIQRANTVARQFFSAATVEEKRKFVRLTANTAPLFDRYFQKHPPVAILDATLAKAIPGPDLILLELDIPSLQRSHQCVVLQRDGEMLVDWETSSWFQESNLEEIRRSQPRTPVRVAVRVAGDSYYNYGFTEKDYICYRLIYPGLALDLFAYARRDSKEAQTLSALLTPLTAGERQVSAVLLVRYPEGPAVPANQVELVSILHEDWVVK